MSLSYYRTHKIYIAATMNYGLGSNDHEEVAYYNKVRKEMEDMKKEPFRRGMPLKQDNPKKLINDQNSFLLIDGGLMLIGLPLLMIFKGKKTNLNNQTS